MLISRVADWGIGSGLCFRLRLGAPKRMKALRSPLLGRCGRGRFRIRSCLSPERWRGADRGVGCDLVLGFGKRKVPFLIGRINFSRKRS